VKALIAAFPSVRVLVVGDLLADHYLYGETERVSREAPVLIVRHELDEVKLGGGANAAANARALGARVTAVGVLGRDLIGDEMARLFAEQGIRCRAVRRFGVVTETRTRILAGGVSTTRQQMLRIDRGANGPLPPQARAALASAVGAEARRADVVMVSDYGAGVLGPETRSALRRVAREVPVCVDSRFELAAYRGMAVAKPNEPELAALTGLPVRSEAELLKAGQAALKRLGSQMLLVTRGRRGMALFQKGEEPRLIPVYGNTEAVDVTGAGDTVGAAFAVALGAGASPERAAYLANLAGALVVQKPGTATVTREELLGELDREGAS
jgi:D-glycero-beta-D-manno-heptose-7-phosphate kinase